MRMNITITTISQNLKTILANAGIKETDLRDKSEGSVVKTLTLQNNGTSIVWLSTFGSQPAGVGIKIAPDTAVEFKEVDLSEVYLIAEADNSNIGLAVF